MSRYARQGEGRHATSWFHDGPHPPAFLEASRYRARASRPASLSRREREILRDPNDFDSHRLHCTFADTYCQSATFYTLHELALEPGPVFDFFPRKNFVVTRRDSVDVKAAGGVCDCRSVEFGAAAVVWDKEHGGIGYGVTAVSQHFTRESSGIPCDDDLQR